MSLPEVTPDGSHEPNSTDVEQTFERERGSWAMWGGKNHTSDDFFVVGTRQYVELYGYEQVVEVEVVEDPDGGYYGWVETGADEPNMIQPRLVMYQIQFTYGPEAEENGGRGKTVRLKVTEKI